MQFDYGRQKGLVHKKPPADLFSREILFNSYLAKYPPGTPVTCYTDKMQGRQVVALRSTCEKTGRPRGTTISLARAVWSTVHGPIDEDIEIHHVNGDPTDNNLRNLMALTSADHKLVTLHLRRRKRFGRPPYRAARDFKSDLERIKSGDPIRLVRKRA